MSKKDSRASFYPHSRAEWRAWLRENQDKSAGVWLVYNKKASGKLTVTYAEAVEEALCFGWIDSLPRKLNDERSQLLFTPRKLRSGWSKLNKTRIEKLIKENLMTDIGLAKIAAAKKDGSWEKLDKIENLEIPQDLVKALAANKTANNNFDAFAASVKKAILTWIDSAQREATRQNRINKTIEMAADNKRALFDKN